MIELSARSKVFQKRKQTFALNMPAMQSIWIGERCASGAEASVSYAIRYLLQRKFFLVLWILAFIASSIVYTKSIHSDFIATTQILLQPHVIVNDGPENLRHFYQLVIDSDQSETELQVLTSQQILYRVFENQKIITSSEVQENFDGFWSYIGSTFEKFQRLETSNPRDIKAFNTFIGRVRARRLGLSYVIEISYRGHSSEQATKIVNAIASTYAAYRLRNVLAREQRRGVYLQSRMSSLLMQLMAAEAGGRLGVIPIDALSDADVRLLGAASPPLGIAYPRMNVLMIMMAGLGLVSGSLVILLPRREPVQHGNQAQDRVDTQRA